MHTLKVIVAMAAMAVTLAPPAASARPAAVPIIVRVYVGYSVTSGTLATASTAAADVFDAAGVVATWRVCGMGAASAVCSEVPGPREVSVRLVGAGPQAAPGSLGFAFVDVEQHAGSLATIFMDRVERLARMSGIEQGTLLGRAMAHEVSHLLLGTSRHAETGLMRAVWSEGELRRDRRSDWRLSKQDSEQLRQAAAARERVPDVPVATLTALSH
jgi:hypothetical protein